MAGGRLERVARLGVRSVIVTLAATVLLLVSLFAAMRAATFGDAGGVFEPPIITQAAAAAALFDRIPPDARPDAIRALNSPMLQFRLISDFEGTPVVLDPKPVFVPIFEAYARALGDRPFGVYLVDRGPVADWFFQDSARLTENLIIVMRLADGAGLAIEAGEAYRWRVLASALTFTTVLVSLILIGLIAWAAFSYARPLGRLAAAAERAGAAVARGDLSGPPMPTDGPRPVRVLADALDRLRGRLARVVDDRTATLAAIAHDMRTYMTRLRMRAEFIDDAAQRDKAVRDLDDMARLVDDALQLGRDAALGEPPERILLAPFLTELISRRRETEPRFSLSVDENAADAAALAPRADLMRALENLLDNAERYAGGAAVSLERRGAAWAIAVRDRGPGAPEDFLARMTEPFTRLEPSRSRATGGAGLGLAIAKARIERCGGALDLSNRSGGGLSAELRVPAADGVDPDAPEARAPR